MGTIDVFVESFTHSTINTLRSKCDGLTVKAGEARPKKPMSLSPGPVSGTVKITGADRGFFAISFTKECILGIIPPIVGQPVAFINTDVHGAVKTLATVIAKRARMRLYQKGIVVQTEPVTLITGERHQILHPFPKVQPMVVPFKTPFGSFTIEISVAEI